MSAQNYFDDIKKVQSNLLDFLESFTDIKEKFQNLISTINDLRITDIKPSHFYI